MSESMRQGRDEQIELEHDGLGRIYRAHVPPEVKEPAALVLMLHGTGGNAIGSLRRYGWMSKSDAEGFIVAAPQATLLHPDRPYSFQANPTQWNTGSGKGFAAERGIDDVGYLAAVIEDAKQRWSIDPRRVFVTGFSNGASMTFRAGAELSDRIAAIAPLLGTCAITPPSGGGGGARGGGMPCFFMVGLDDPLNRYEGGEVMMPWGWRVVSPPMRETVTKWKRYIGAPPEDPPEMLRDGDGVRGVRWRGTSGVAFDYYEVAGLGHTWPGGIEVLPEHLVGKTTDRVDATGMIWAFFREHTSGGGGGGR
jgi:polyhydroxybutyrate depolymerase